MTLTIFLNIIDDIVHTLFKIPHGNESLPQRSIKSSSRTRIWLVRVELDQKLHIGPKPKLVQFTNPNSSIPAKTGLFFVFATENLNHSRIS